MLGDAPGTIEDQRLAALARYGVLDGGPEPEFDGLAELAADICRTPVALVTFVDANGQLFKSRIGYDGPQAAPLDAGFCTLVVRANAALVIPNTSADPVHAAMPAVLDLGVRFYAGVPLTTLDGHALGALCVLDHAPRPEGLDDAQLRALRTLAAQVVARLDLQRAEAQARRQGERAARHGRRLALLADASARLLEAEDSGAMVRDMHALLRDPFRLDACIHHRCVADEFGLIAVAGLGPEHEAHAATPEFTHAICGTVAATRQPAHLTGIMAPTDPAPACLKAIGLDTLLSAPLLAGEDLLGTLTFGRRAEAFSPGEREVLLTMSANVAIALKRLHAEAALLAQQAELRAIFETLPAAVWFTHDPDARQVTGNPAAAELMRLPAAANHSLTAMPAERPGHFRALRDGVEITPEHLPMQRAARGEVVPAEEMDIAFADGHTVTVLLRAQALRDHSGGLTGAVCAAIDITDRKRAEAALRQSEEEFRALGENLPNPCWIADAQGWIYWYNRGWYDYTGTVEADMRGWGWQSVHHPDVLADVMERWTGAIARGAPFEMTFPLRGADGAFRPFLTRIVPVRDAAGAITRWFGNNVDVSEQQRTEAALRSSQDELRRLNEQLEARVAAEVLAREEAQAMLAQAQRMEALGQLAGGIAHDFNNVLQAVSGGLGLIERRAGDAEAVRQLARMASDAAGRGAAITGRLLAFARRGELRARAIAPAALLEGVGEILSTTLGSGIAVRIEVAPDAPLLLADGAQLETVLVNLAVNARDAMPGGGSLHIAARAELAASPHSAGLRAGAYLRLDLTDTGSGMDAATLARASEPFFTTKPLGQGTGLGLAMARGFAQQSGGALAIRSAPGRGTTVTLWFPRAQPGAETEGEAVASPAEIPGGDRGRVLVVDDDAMVRQVLAGHLEDRGYHVLQASDGLDAVARLDAGAAIDLLVTDFAMPGMNGPALIREARRRLPRLPVLLLTGYADPSAQTLVEAHDPVFLQLQKPVSGDDLAARVAGLFDARAEAAD